MDDKEIPDAFIVTVATEQGGFESDMALPSSLTVGELRGKILDVLKALDEEKFRAWRGCRLCLGHRQLQDGETLISAGAFGGSRLIAVEE